jgi:GPI mannosyltransferase 2
MILTGLRFCAGTVVRSNGILAGIPFLVEAISAALAILSRGMSSLQINRLISLVLGGILVGFGLLYPQFLAYEEYCYGRSPDERRPWCNRMLPSIFTYVQSHYW